MKKLNFEFSWDERISKINGKPVMGNYDRSIRTMTIFLGSLGRGFQIAKTYGFHLYLTMYDEDLSIKTCEERSEYISLIEFSKTIQHECLHAGIEDIREKVEREKEEWIIEEIEEILNES